MNILITAGNTYVPIDRVRGITNVFSGRTGTQIAVHAHERGHTVTLLTSHPEMISTTPAMRWTMHSYREFADLDSLLKKELGQGFDALIHCAAVSDYQSAGIFAPGAHTRFDPISLQWHGAGAEAAQLVDRSAAKVKSAEPELWLRLVRTPKLIDRVRKDWQFTGILVKFKLEAGMDYERLLLVAEHSRQQSDADLMVANTLEGMHDWAALGPVAGQYERVNRQELASCLLEQIERLHAERSHG